MLTYQFQASTTLMTVNLRFPWSALLIFLHGTTFPLKFSGLWTERAWHLQSSATSPNESTCNRRDSLLGPSEYKPGDTVTARFPVKYVTLLGLWFSHLTIAMLFKNQSNLSRNIFAFHAQVSEHIHTIESLHLRTVNCLHYYDVLHRKCCKSFLTWLVPLLLRDKWAR